MSLLALIINKIICLIKNYIEFMNKKLKLFIYRYFNYKNIIP